LEILKISLSILFAFSTNTAWSKTNTIKESLENPSLSQSVETLFGSLRAVVRHNDQVVTVPINKRFLITTPFKGVQSTRILTFGEITESKRVEMKIGQIIPNWRGIYGFKDRLVLLNGADFTLRQVNEKTFETITSGSTIWDRILPARDRGGEAPNFEITKLRKTFKKAFLKTQKVDGSKIAGWTHWKTGKNARIFYMTTFIKDFPLVQVECSLENPTSCSITRKCNLKLPNKVKQEDMRGIAYSPKVDEILIANTTQHSIMRFKINSCNSVSYQGDISLPKNIFSVNNLAIDSDENLWVVTTRADNYNNASLFYWTQEQWSGIKTSPPPKSESSPGKASSSKN